MRRTLIAVATALAVPLSLTLGAGVAQAHGGPGNAPRIARSIPGDTEVTISSSRQF
jgi:hypothetical protein